MPGNTAAHQGPYTNLRINDWTAGIVSQDYSPSKLGTYLQQRIPSVGGKITSSGNSYGITGLPNGGLLLGPFLQSSPQIATVTNQGAHCAVSGIFWKQISSPPLVYFTISGWNSSSESSVVIAQLNVSAHTITVITGFSGTAALTEHIPWPSFLYSALLSNGTDFVEYLGFSGGPGAQIGTPLYSPSGNQNLTGTTLTRNGIATPIGGRVWYLEGEYGGIAYLPDNTIGNEYVNISFTDPTTVQTAANLSMNTAHTLIDYDNITSYGAWGQIVSGEVLLVKMTGGGVIVTGDIFSPNVTKLPAIQSTNGLMGNSCLTPIGLVYRSYEAGVWAWDGGATATKISTQLSDSIWPENYTTTNAPGQANNLVQFYGSNYYNIQQIDNFIFTDGGMFYDMTTNAWWRLPPYIDYTAVNPIPSVAKFFYPASYQGSNTSFGSIWFDFPVMITGTYDLYQSLWSFDAGQVDSFTAPPNGYYHSYWESNPIQLNDDNLVEVQELVISVQGTGQLSIACLGVEGQVQTFKPVNVSNTNFGKVRMTCKFTTDVLVLQVGWINLSSSSLGATPIIESISVNYRERFPVRVAN